MNFQRLLAQPIVKDPGIDHPGSKPGMPEASAQSESRIDYREIPKQSDKAEKNRIAPHFSAVTLASRDGSRNTDGAKRVQSRPASAG
ncbi:hypothetical protein [Ralstonia solanacearum]|uniref:hypothetical protein n=1 Tax=Ralstonia solanacearum TaxID=305 RepID=UPI0018AF6D3A|nr:hypothetical protein [Ralstonia solanacearum]